MSDTDKQNDAVGAFIRTCFNKIRAMKYELDDVQSECGKYFDIPSSMVISDLQELQNHPAFNKEKAKTREKGITLSFRLEEGALTEEHLLGGDLDDPELGKRLWIKARWKSVVPVFNPNDYL
jgi:hypothetical protein